MNGANEVFEVDETLLVFDYFYLKSQFSHLRTFISFMLTIQSLIDIFAEEPIILMFGFMYWVSMDFAVSSTSLMMSYQDLWSNVIQCYTVCLAMLSHLYDELENGFAFLCQGSKPFHFDLFLYLEDYY